MSTTDEDATPFKPVSPGDVIRACKQKFHEEWCLAATDVAARDDGLTCVHLRTGTPTHDTLGYTPDGSPVLKSIFLRNDRTLRNEIVSHYRGLGFAWVDILCIGRHHWKIFLTPGHTNSESAQFGRAVFPEQVPPETFMDLTGQLYANPAAIWAPLPDLKLGAPPQ